MPDLKQQTVSGAKWLMFNQVLEKVISVGTFAVLARILEPDVFGLFAMTFIAIDGLGLFKTFGLDAGIVQKKDCPEEAMHTTFVLVQGMGILLFAICFLIAPYVGLFFNNPEVGRILRVLGSVLMISTFGRVPAAILNKKMQFRTISLIQLAGAIVNCILAISLSLFSPTVWSLVWAYIAKQTFMTVTTWLLSGYKLKLQFHKEYAKELFHFGKFMVGLGVLWYIGANLSHTIVGKLLGATALGYFALAGNMANFINTHFTNVISRVMFPAYSAIQDDPERVKRAYLKTVKFISMISIPFGMGLCMLAEEIVLSIYGVKWTPVIPLVRLFGFMQTIIPVFVASGALFRGCGKPHYDFNLTLLNLSVRTPLSIMAALRWGLWGVIAANIMTTLIFVPIQLRFVRKIVGFQYQEFFAQLIPSASCAGVMLAAIVLIKLVFHLGPLTVLLGNQYLLLGVFSAVGGLAYAGAVYWIDRTAAFEVKKMIFKKA